METALQGKLSLQGPGLETGTPVKKARKGTKGFWDREGSSAVDRKRIETEPHRNLIREKPMKSWEFRSRL
jgi:hypothetical protein